MKTKIINQQKYIDKTQTIELLKCAKTTLYYYTKQGFLPEGIIFEGKSYYLLKDVEKLAEQKTIRVNSGRRTISSSSPEKVYMPINIEDDTEKMLNINYTQDSMYNFLVHLINLMVGGLIGYGLIKGHNIMSVVITVIWVVYLYFNVFLTNNQE